MTPPALIFDKAVSEFVQGDLHDPNGVLVVLLDSHLDNAGSASLTRLIAVLRSNNRLADDFVAAAHAKPTQNADYHFNLARILNGLGRADAAEAQFRLCLRCDPSHAEAFAGLGHLLRAARRLDDAVRAYGEAVRLRPNDPHLRAILGNLMHEAGRLPEAELHYREACRLKPDYAEVFNNLGKVLHDRACLAEAEASLRQALTVKPEFPEAHNNLGNLLRDAHRPDEAVECCREALRLRPDYANAHCNLANALRDLGDNRAEWHYREAIRLRADFTEAHNNLATFCCDWGRMEEAVAAYRRALELRPDYPEAHNNLAMALLACGQYEEGWQRFDTFRKSAIRNDLTRPRWEGEDLAGRTLLLHAEQGFGDTIQFCRFVPLIAVPARIILEAPRALVAWLRTLPGVERVVVRGEPLPDYDVHCPLLSLPRLLGSTLANIPTQPYLTADPSRIAEWRERLRSLPGLRVGIAWAGNPATLDDRWRSMTFDQIKPLLQITGVSFVSLQVWPAGGEPIVSAAVADWTSELRDFADSAALISALDLVISVDTAVVHVAGALRRPVWLLNRFNNCWRWLKCRDDSPWYPTLRQFRQPHPGDWDSVVRNAAAALRLRVAEGEASAVERSELNRDLASALRALGRTEDSERHYREAIRIDAGHAEAHCALANLMLEQGRFDEAETHGREALRLRPGLETACNDLGIALFRLGRHQEAEVYYREALRLRPGFAEAQLNLGGILRDRRDFQKAEQHYREALRLRPDWATAHYALGQTLQDMDRFPEAEQQYRTAVRLNPDCADWHNNLAKLLLEMRCLDEARQCFAAALRLRPDDPEAHTALGIASLLAGDFAGGWPDYEWRWRLKKPPVGSTALVGPAWNGDDLRGRVILVHAEQGFGDTIHFCRLAARLGSSGARVILEVQPELVRLLRSLRGIDQVIGRGDPRPAYDVHCPLLSLPRLLGITVETIPAATPYLFADPRQTAAWRQRLESLEGLRVGVAWAGSPTMVADRHRSITPEHFAGLAALPGVSLISLQKCRAGAHRTPAGLTLHDWTVELQDFADTAALVTALDLVISIDTAVVHVAGALGRPVWLLNRFNGCWRWLLDVPHSPWYPTLRQFRQSRLGDWDDVLSLVGRALQDEIAERRLLPDVLSDPLSPTLSTVARASPMRLATAAE